LDTRHLLVYLSWETIRRWKQDYPPGDQIGDKAPFAYGSDQARLGRLARPGDVLWVLSSPRFARYRLPPTLVARLQVERLVDQRAPGKEVRLVNIPQPSAGWRYVVLADREYSRYYPLNNAYSTLLSLSFAGGAPSLRDCPHCEQLVAGGKGLYAGLPAHLQTIRQLAPGAETTLEAFAGAVAEGQVVFLSYRWSEATPLAMRLAAHLSERGVACWWDQWMVPQCVAEEDIRLDRDLLSAALTDGIRQSTWMVALVTATYYTSWWTAYEWQRAGEEMNNPRRARPLRRAEVLLGGDTSRQADLVLAAAEADSLAAQLLAAMEKSPRLPPTP
jgi:hypothetical protein